MIARVTLTVITILLAFPTFGCWVCHNNFSPDAHCHEASRYDTAQWGDCFVVAWPRPGHIGPELPHCELFSPCYIEAKNESLHDAANQLALLDVDEYADLMDRIDLATTGLNELERSTRTMEMLKLKAAEVRTRLARTRVISPDAAMALVGDS